MGNVHEKRRRYARATQERWCYDCGATGIGDKRRCAICLEKQRIARAARIASQRAEALEGMRRLRHAG
jgi:hypothetical protein